MYSEFTSLKYVFGNRVGDVYQSRTIGPDAFIYWWDREIAKKIFAISPKRARNRVESYIIMDEVIRARKKLETKSNVSIRFGKEKKGHGIKGERGDFCLIAGVIKKTELTLFYRSIEMIGGLHYDQCIILALEKMLNLKFKKIFIMTRDSHVFALKGNSNEKLFKQLWEIYEQN